MNKENCKKRKREGNFPITISIRISKSVSKWIKDKNLSPTGIFREACKELGFKKDE